jgi:hypothetical protein
MTNNPNGWPPVRFVGGSPDVMTVTSDCGIPGVDTFHLTGVGPDSTAWFDVTLTEYDAANMRFTGHEVGQVFAPNDTVYEIDDNVSMAYEPGSGEWQLKTSWVNEAPIENCAPPSPAG